MGEVASLPHQPVQIGRMHLRVVDGADRAEHQVIRNQKQEVRLLAGLAAKQCSAGTAGYGCGCNGGDAKKFATVHRVLFLRCSGGMCFHVGFISCDDDSADISADTSFRQTRYCKDT